MTVGLVVLFAADAVGLLAVARWLFPPAKPAPPTCRHLVDTRSLPRARELVTVGAGVLVTPRGVEIPTGMLAGDVDFETALEWLDYVERLG